MYQNEKAAPRLRKMNAWPMNFEEKKQKSNSRMSLDRFMKGNDENLVTIGDDQKICSCMFGVKKTLSEFSQSTSLHGVQYIGKKDITLLERCFWLFSCLLAMALSVYFISNVYDQWSRAPVIISLNPTATPIELIPFPAVTICNMNQAKKSEADNIVSMGSELENHLLDDICSANDSFDPNATLDHSPGDWDTIQKFMIRVSQSCTEMLRVCLWKQNNKSCEDIFNPTLTDDGICCTFNKVHRNFLFRNPRDLGDLNITFPFESVDWTPENGFPENSSYDATPFRTGSGSHLGLSLVLDAAIDDYYCSSTVSAGFKIFLHSPVETPKMRDFAYTITPGRETRISAIPYVSDATYQIRGVSVDKRKCFFANERQLYFYRTYTENNCALECEANLTLKLCGCVSYHMPKSRNTKICGRSQELCSRNAKASIDTNVSQSCDCLPGCTEITYGIDMSTSIMTGSFLLRTDLAAGIPRSYFIKNMAVVHVFYAKDLFTRLTKDELFGFTQFLSNTGGLLGLFLGFSFLSFIEILYFMSLKVCCWYHQGHLNETERQNSKKVTVYPFVK